MNKRMAALATVCAFVSACTQAPAKTAEASSSPAPAVVQADNGITPIRAAFTVSSDDVVKRVNTFWTQSGRPGAFAPAAPEKVEGGDEVSACVSRTICTLVERWPDARVRRVGVQTPADGRDQDALDAVIAPIALMHAVAPSDDTARVAFADLFMAAKAHGSATKTLNGQCVAVVVGQETLLTAIEPQPCDRA